VERVLVRAAIDERLAAGARLLTLVGPPGTGKTRLALRTLAASRETAPARRAVFVDLAAAEDEEAVAIATARALGVSLAGARGIDALHARVMRVLEKKPTLLVLDNVEQVIPHVVRVGEWIARAPELVVIATSRERLRLAAEVTLEIPPLALPPSEAGVPEVLASESVALLVARAHGYAPTDADVPMLVAIVRALEALPLAIELAASRLPLLGARALAEMLGSDRAALDGLGPAPRDVAPRQQTLRRAIEWSWAILDEAERRALAWLSLFRSDFATDTAIALLDEASSLAWVSALADKSLVVVDAATKRLRLLVAVRAFAAEKLAERDDAVLARSRLAAHVAARATTARTGSTTRAARSGYAWLHAEVDTLGAALAAAESLPLDRTRARERAQLTLALHHVARRVGPAGRDAAALDAASTLLPSLDGDLRVELVVARAHALRDRGETTLAAETLEAEAASVGSSVVLAALGEALLACGRFDAAARALGAALEAARDPRERLAAHAGLGLVAHGRGDLASADRHYAEALDIAIAIGEPAAEARARRDLGNLSLQRGELDRALAHYEEALAKRPGDDLRLEGVVRGNLGIVHQERGQLDAALAELRRARECLRQVGDRPFEAHLSGYLGSVLHERGQLELAQVAYGEAIDILREVGDVRLEGVFLAARAVALGERGAFGRADNDLALAQRRLDTVGDGALLAALSLHRASVELARATHERRRSDEAASTARDAITRHQDAIASSDDARFALRLLRRALPADALEVGPDGRWFGVPGRERVSLESRPTLARVLDALVRARLDHSGQALAWDALLAAGWPGEKVLPAAAQNRVRVALSTLRTLGLRTLLVTNAGGHRIDERIAVRTAR
jgi:predicted ATPase/Tfp pilus assembly protein PilF